MKFKDKLKKDKGFRVQVVIIAALILLFYGSFLSPDKKEAISQETCNAANLEVDSYQSELNDELLGACDFPTTINTFLGGDICIRSNIITQRVLQDDVNLCIGLDCFIGRQPESSDIIGAPDTFGCFSCVPNGLKTQHPDNCCSKEAADIVYKDGYDFLCKALPEGTDPSTKICNSFEQGIADMMEGVGIKLQCKTAYFLFIIGMAFMVLIMMAAML